MTLVCVLTVRLRLHEVCADLIIIKHANAVVLVCCACNAAVAMSVLSLACHAFAELLVVCCCCCCAEQVMLLLPSTWLLCQPTSSL